MFSRLRAFLSRHRRKFLIGGVLVGSAFVLSRYIQKALREWQERETKLFIDRTKKQQHYESIVRTCNETTLSLTPTIRDCLSRHFQTDELIQEIRNTSSSKLEIWEQLKILGFSKITFIVYLTSMLTVTLRIQLSLMGGYLYRDTIQDATNKISPSMQQKYLTLTENLLGDGADKLHRVIKDNVSNLLRDKSLKGKWTLQDLEQFFWAVHAAITNDVLDPVSAFPAYVIPETRTRSSDELYERIMVETRDLLESVEVASLLTSSVSRGFTYVLDDLSQFLVSKAQTNEPSTSNSPTFSEKMVELEKISIPLAKLIPIVIRLVSNQRNDGDLLHNWSQQLVLMDNLKIMSANVYETFSVE